MGQLCSDLQMRPERLVWGHTRNAGNNGDMNCGSCISNLKLRKRGDTPTSLPEVMKKMSWARSAVVPLSPKPFEMKWVLGRKTRSLTQTKLCSELRWLLTPPNLLSPSVGLVPISPSQAVFWCPCPLSNWLLGDAVSSLMVILHDCVLTPGVSNTPGLIFPYGRISFIPLGSVLVNGKSPRGGGRGRLSPSVRAHTSIHWMPTMCYGPC